MGTWNYLRRKLSNIIEWPSKHPYKILAIDLASLPATAYETLLYHIDSFVKQHGTELYYKGSGWQLSFPPKIGTVEGAGGVQSLSEADKAIHAILQTKIPHTDIPVLPTLTVVFYALPPLTSVISYLYNRRKTKKIGEEASNMLEEDIK